MKKLFEVEFTEYNGEQEYRNVKLVEAKNADQAMSLMLKWLRNWYDDDDVEQIENGWEFFCGSLIVKIRSAGETTPELFKEKAFREALTI